MSQRVSQLVLLRGRTRATPTSMARVGEAAVVAVAAAAVAAVAAVVAAVAVAVAVASAWRRGVCRCVPRSCLAAAAAARMAAAAAAARMGSLTRGGEPGLSVCLPPWSSAAATAAAVVLGLRHNAKLLSACDAASGAAAAAALGEAGAAAAGEAGEVGEAGAGALDHHAPLSLSRLGQRRWPGCRPSLLFDKRWIAELLACIALLPAAVLARAAVLAAAELA